MAAEFQLHNQQEVAVESVRKNTSVTGHFWEDCGTESRKEKETLTLQEAFEKFRKKRQEELWNLKRIQLNICRQVKDPDRTWQLRLRFLEKAESYIGVPYAKKYHEPGTPEYESPLFLDCCGLVRRVVRDLKDDFEFIIGPGNQAYHFDTLPITTTQEKMEPGDLVFISGTYFNPKAKFQPHDIVHVEIWVGDGERTLGARWGRGKVQNFDSYKFVSTSYGDMKYHFKSINTWLQGICVSHCSEHNWSSPRRLPGKKSIFSSGDEDEAAGEEVDVENLNPAKKQALEENKETTWEMAFREPTTVPCDPNMAISLSSQNEPLTVKSKTAKQRENELKATRDMETVKTCVSAFRANAHEVNLSEDVQDVPPQEIIYLTDDTGLRNSQTSDGTEAQRDQFLADSMNVRTDRGAEGKKETMTVKPEEKRKKKKQARNRAVQAVRCEVAKSPASNPSSSGTGASQPEGSENGKQTGTAYQKTGDNVNPRLTNGKKQEDSKEQGPYFYIGGTNGAALIASFCENKGWKRILDNNREDYILKWCETKISANYQTFHEGKQMLNQIPNNKVLTTKFGLCSSLKDNERIMNKYGRIMFSKFMKLEEFYPETYRMDVRSERHAFYRVFQEGQIWISKPAESSQGKGIFLLRTLDDVATFFEKLESVEENPYFRMCFYNSPINRIVQRYVVKPLLLENRKFDIRSYFLIACTSPYVTFFRHGYAKLTCNEYNPNSDDLTDHLTNQFIQKKNPLYNDMKEDTIWSMERLNDYINEKYMEAKRLPKDWVFTILTKRMQQIMTQCFIATKARLGNKLGYFDLLGCDIMIDQNFKVWLLEMNSNPSLQRNCEILKTVIPKVMNEALAILLPLKLIF
ncbi:probable beta-tubulin polyglutamylase isoform X3 [Heptranchias perlo]|uniref:probable beta-tubulin polyglutamylase isoform X3 n=1 Tax=Heptranchias perlo TaxID=212740 RepID=UPI00355A0182